MSEHCSALGCRYPADCAHIERGPTVSPEERFSVVHVGESRTTEDAERELNRCLAHLRHARHLARQILSNLDGLGGGVTRKSVADLRRWAELLERDGER